MQPVYSIVVPCYNGEAVIRETHRGLTDVMRGMGEDYEILYVNDGSRDKTFPILKFRTMRIDTPHDVPTHMLEDPEQYITKLGKFLRKTSLDELPQIFNIFVGQMSIIGPRPALWNQDDLIAERDKYGANDIKPGLTGWAQINGRDELESDVKARLDGEYVQKQSFWFDCKCFFGSVGVFSGDESVVEGGTGEIKKKEKAK